MGMTDEEILKETLDRKEKPVAIEVKEAAVPVEEAAKVKEAVAGGQAE